jgi:hypothetical protein
MASKAQEELVAALGSAFLYADLELRPHPADEIYNPLGSRR